MDRKNINRGFNNLIMAIPWQLRIVIMMNRKAGLNLITRAAAEAVQQWARDIKKMRMGLLCPNCEQPLILKIDPKSLNSNTEVMRLHHYSRIPVFHHSM